jgi:hypothetical protein
LHGTDRPVQPGRLLAGLSAGKNVCFGEIVSLEKERGIRALGKSLGGAVAKVEPGLRVDTLAITVVGFECD